MADKELKVVITAQDGASRVFTEVSGSAKEAGNSVQRAGEQGKAGMDSMSQSASQASQSLNEAARAATVVGGVITGAFAAPMLAGAKAAWGQVDAVEQATVAFRALEPDVAAVNTVLAELIEYARSDLGRLFSRQELFAAAQGLKVMGAETENLTRYVEIMGRSVSMGAGTWDELGQVIGRVGSTGQLTGVEFDNLTKMGYQLDSSLRNTTVTWDELFSILDQGMSQVEGQSDTIQGQLTMTETAVRNLGLAFLQVDSETSQFIEGGLGDRMVSGLSQVRELLSALEPLAGAAGSAFATLAGVASDMAYAFSSLPDWLQTGILGFTAIGGAATLAAGSLALIIPRIVAAGAAIRGLGMAFTTALTSIGPVGWAIIGIGAALSAGAALWGRHRRGVEDSKAAYEALDAAAKTVQQTISDTYLSGDYATGGVMALMDRQTAVAVDRWEVELNRGRDMWNEFTEAVIDGDQEAASAFAESNFFKSVMESARREGFFDDMDESVVEALLRGDIAAMEQYLPQLNEYMARYYDAYLPTEGDRTAILEAQDRMFRLLLNPDVDSGQVMNTWWSLMDEYIINPPTPNLQGFSSAWAEAEADIITSVDNIASSLDGLTNTQREFALEMAQLRLDGDGKLADDLETINSLLGDQSQLSDEAAAYVDFFIKNVESGTIALGEYEHELFVLREMYKGGVIDQDTYESGLVDIALRSAEATAATRQFEETASGLGSTLGGIANDAMEEYEEYLELVRETSEGILELTGNASLLNQINMVGLGNDATMAAMGVNNAAAALETTFRVIVGNTNAIGSQVDAVEQWGEALIGVQGEYSKLDDLVKAGRITGTSGVFDDGSQYAQAQQAYNDILEDNAAIQEHILTIQAQQAPMIAQNVAALEDYMRQIADMNDGTEEGARRQMEALAWMDEGLQGQAAQTLGIVQNLQAMGADGEAAFRAMADSAAVTNPYLFSMYETMGLISNVVRNEDGTVLSYDVNLDGADSVLGKIGELTESINSLVDALYLIYINGDNEDALDAIWTVETEVTDLDGKTATVSINLLDNATNGINAAMRALLDLDGSSATTTINTVYQNRGIGPGVALGGVVQEYASGGVVIRAGEVGPEVAHFANGGTALIPNDGLYSVPAGTYITPNHAISNYGGNSITVNVNGPVMGVPDIAEQVMAELVPAIERASDSQRRQLGVS